MENEKKGWRQFKDITLDRKRFTKKIKGAENATQRHAHRFVVKRLDNARMVTREITIWLVLVGAMIAALGLQLLWGQASYMKEGIDKGGRFVEGVKGPLDTLNPLFVATDAEASVSRLVFSSLYNYDRSGSLHHDIATGMSVDDTHKVYTIKIRHDASWHDNTPVTAKDVVFSINLIKNPAVRSPLRVNWIDVQATVVDQYTVQFTLPAVYAAFPYALTFPILPEHALEKVAPGAIRESAFSRSPVGSGPFIFNRLQAADTITNHKSVHMVANKQYYGGQPKLDSIELQVYDTEDQIVKAVQGGELAGATDLSVSSKQAINANIYNVTPQAIDSGVFLLLNTTNPIFKDAKTRQALQAATDTEVIRKMLGNDLLPLHLPVLSNQLSGTDIPPTPAIDLAKARTLLDDAGWKMEGSYRKKDSTPLEITITTTKNKAHEQVIDIITKQWQKIGVKVNRNVVDTSSVSSNFVQDVLQRRGFDILLYELMIGADPDVYAYWHSSQVGQSGYNFSNYVSKAADATLASARSRLEPDLRNAKYKQFAREWLADVPAIALYQPVSLYVSNKNVTAVQNGTRLVTGSDRYADVLYWTVNSQAVYKTP